MAEKLIQLNRKGVKFGRQRGGRWLRFLELYRKKEIVSEPLRLDKETIEFPGDEKKHFFLRGPVAGT